MKSTFLVAGFVLSSALFSAGCVLPLAQDFDLALSDSRQKLSQSVQDNLAHFDAEGLTSYERIRIVPHHTGTVKVYGDVATSQVLDNAILEPLNIAGLSEAAIAVAAGVQAQPLSQVQFYLLSVAQSPQSETLLKSSTVRYAFADMAYRVGHIACLKGSSKDDERARLNCDLLMAFGQMSEGYKALGTGAELVAASIKAQDQSFENLYGVILGIIERARTAGNGPSAVMVAMKNVADPLHKVAIERQTPSTSFGSMVRAMQSGVKNAADVVASMTALVGAQDETAVLAAIEDISTDGNSSAQAMNEVITGSSFDENALVQLNETINAAKDHNSLLESERAALGEMQMSFNMQYLGLQQKMQDESRRFTLLSNVMKTKHDTVKNSINNVR